MDELKLRGRRRRFGYCSCMLLATAALLGACTDSTDATRPFAQRKTTASFATSPSALHISTVSFDLDVESTALGGASRSMRAHIDRSAGANAWRTTVTLIDDPRAARLPAAPWRPKQLVFDESNKLTVYRADGRVARMPDPSHLPRPSGTASPARTTVASDVIVGTGWIDDLVLGSDARAKASAATISGASQSGRDAQGLDHYSKVAGGHSTDYAVDPASGVVKGVSLTDGQRTSRAVFEYVNTASGLSIRTRSHVEHAGGKITDSRTITISNVVIDGKGIMTS
jgi:hypothetical protein